jgi:UDP-N-acetylmuramate-alanine ligase
MNISELKTAYFLGIGGIGMSAIARYFRAIGMDVHGYDKTRNEFSKQLESICFNWRWIYACGKNVCFCLLFALVPK